MTRTTLLLSSLLFASACSLGELEPQGAELFAEATSPQHAIIYAAGVGNPGFGDNAVPGSAGALDTREARQALATWVEYEIARGQLDPRFAKASVTMVGNSGRPITDGPFGGWDREAIALITARLMELKLDQVANVLVVSHSNGVISTQQAYSNFIANLPAEGSATMCIHFHHTQAAGSQLSDFVPLQARFYNGQNGIHPSFRFTYNREDWMTYDPYLLSTVGRRESGPWIDRVLALAPARAQQLVNPSDLAAGGGGGHAQVGTLQDLSTDSIVAGYQVEAGRIIMPSCAR